MAGAGYDIGLASSDAWSVPQTSNSATIINYGSGSSFVTPTTNNITSEPVAVATTKSPGASTGIGGTGSGQVNPTGGNTGFPGELQGSPDYGNVPSGIAGALQGNTILYIAVGSILLLLILRR